MPDNIFKNNEKEMIYIMKREKLLIITKCKIVFSNSRKNNIMNIMYCYCIDNISLLYLTTIEGKLISSINLFKNTSYTSYNFKHKFIASRFFSYSDFHAITKRPQQGNSGLKSTRYVIIDYCTSKSLKVFIIFIGFNSSF